MANHTATALIALSLGACSPADQQAPQVDLSGLPRSTVHNPDSALEVYFTDPGVAPGEGTDPLLDDALIALIDASTTSLDLCLYEFKLGEVTEAVVAAVDRGVAVRMVGDGDETEDAGYIAIAAAGVAIVPRPKGDRIMHNKFVVVDGQVVWTGSTNLTETGVFMNNNNAIVVESVAMASEYTREFTQMFDGALFGRNKDDVTEARALQLGDTDIVFHFAPEHNPIDFLVDVVDSADHTIEFMVFSYTHPDVVEAMLDALDRGVEVVGVFDESQARGAWSIDEALAKAGIPVYIDGNKNSAGFAGGKLHHKVMVVDGGAEDSDPVVVTGSFNWSRNATLYNDENLVELRDPALLSLYQQEFCRVFAVATPHPDYLGPEATPCARQPKVIINEFMANPDGTDRGQEYVELVNVGATAVDLSGWTLGDEVSPSRNSFTDLVLQPGQGVVVFDRGDHNDVPNAVLASGRYLSLNNTGDTITLADRSGAIIDQVAYDEGVNGISWNRATDMDPDAGFALHDTLDGATTSGSPGTRADGKPFDHIDVPDFRVVINELLPNPVGTDRGAEFVELVNLGPDPADLDGFTFHDALGEKHVFDDIVLAPGQALVVYDRGDHAEIPGAINSSSGGLSLNNAGDTYSLVDADGGLHDQVAWERSREGVSWNRATDGAEDPGMIFHEDMDGATDPTSPGTRADGSPWTVE